MLVPVEHPRRLSSPREAEAFFRALGRPLVSARGFETTRPDRVAALVRAIAPEHDHTLVFTGGGLGLESRRALDRLALSAYHYLDVQAGPANLRCWPGDRRAWVTAWVGAEAASAALGVPLSAGANLAGEAKVQVGLDEHGHGAPIHLDTASIPGALRFFHQLTTAAPRLARSFITGIAGETAPALVAFLTLLAESGGTVEAVLELEPARARAITELFLGEPVDWQSEGLIVELPSGTITAHLDAPVTVADEARCLAEISAALEAALESRY
jgi:hypothetical protein